MTYPPGSPGYPSTPQATPQYLQPTQQLTKLPDAGIHAAEGASKLPLYLTAAVAVLGLAVYLSSFGPLYGIDTIGSAATSFTLELAIVAAVAAGICAAVALLPKQAFTTAVLTVLSVLGFLLVISSIINIPDGVSIDWGLWLVLAFSVLQAGVAVAVLLYDSGVISAPTPRPKYDQQQQQYGQFGGPGGYYGQPQHQQGPQQQQQRAGYPQQQYGGGYPGGGPSTGGFSPMGQQGQQGQQSGPPTPPTGFPTYGQPQSPGAGSGPSTQPPSQSTQPPSSSSPQSGQSPS